ncbi:LysR substrate-binding domain-containing protein [Bordetella genomosp. 13]|uniref:LysR substrate-binding domain-containing protein n=1 Tax=Bordetella genomosp. 13 TaxID=463040 RepID=UPI00119D4513|nr:LysR substrate-binding domain-containing protein [Bordetella genomosp. 13]
MRYRLPPLNTLRIFEAVMRHGSIRQAAGELCLTPQAVSQQLKHLESHLDQQLFQRDVSSLKPTAAAQQFYVHVRDGLDRFADGVQAVQVSPEKPHLYLYVSPYFATEFLVPRLGLFTSSMPDLDLRMAVGVELIELDAQGLDAAIHWNYGAPPGYEETPLLDDLKVLVATPALLTRMPVAEPRDLLRHNVISSLVENTMWEDTLDLLGVSERPTQSIMRLHTHAAMMEAVLAGLGVGFLSYADAVRHVTAGRLVAPFGMDVLERLPRDRMPRFSLLVKANHHYSPVLQQFTRWLLDDVCTEQVSGYPSSCRMPAEHEQDGGATARQA